MTHFKSTLPIAAAITIALSMLAGCRPGSQSPGVGPQQALTVRYAIAVLPERDATRVIDGVGVEPGNTNARARAIASLMATSDFQQICHLTASFAGPDPPELSTLPSAQPGDRDFVVRVIAGLPLVNTTTPVPACGTIGDLWFHLGGGSNPGRPPGPPVAIEPLQINAPTADVIGRILLTGASSLPSQGAIPLPPLDFSSPEFGTGLLRSFNPGPPRRATGNYSFIDSVPLAGSSTAVIVAEVDFDLTRP